MKYQNLTQQEQDILKFLVDSGKITNENLPKGIWVGLDSMGPARDPKTDALFPGMREVLHAFTQTMADYDLGLAVATNGPAKEAHDILDSLDKELWPKAFGTAEGGGVIVHFAGGLENRIIAPPNETEDLKRLEDAVKDNKLLKALLEDTSPSDGGIPIRTEYHTNIVLTLPVQYETLKKRLESKGVDIRRFIEGIDEKNYVAKVLSYANEVFSAKIAELKLSGSIGSVIVKSPNRRVYVPTLHIYDEKNNIALVLSKQGGAIVGSNYAAMARESGEFSLDRSVYVADNAIDTTRGENATVLGASERSMIKNGGKQARMAFNITMSQELPRMSYVEGIHVLSIGSGAKALEAIDLLYKLLYPNAPAAALKIRK